MKLNNDCIRDILLYIESNTDFEKDCIDVDTLVNDLTSYDKNTIYYHLRMISQAGFVDNVFFADCRPYTLTSLSLQGHQFLANIHSDATWKKTKEIAKTIGSSSLDAIKDIAAKVVSELIKQSF